jgi:hypothetical protein
LATTRGSVILQPTINKVKYAAGDRGHCRAVSDDEICAAFMSALYEKIQKACLVDRVDFTGGFISKQDGWVIHEGQGQACPRQLARRKLSRQGAGASGQPHRA